jgi:hypothetical protein
MRVLIAGCDRPLSSSIVIVRTPRTDKEPEALSSLAFFLAVVSGKAENQPVRAFTSFCGIPSLNGRNNLACSRKTLLERNCRIRRHSASRILSRAPTVALHLAGKNALSLQSLRIVKAQEPGDMARSAASFAVTAEARP